MTEAQFNIAWLLAVGGVICWIGFHVGRLTKKKGGEL